MKQNRIYRTEPPRGWNSIKAPGKPSSGAAQARERMLQRQRRDSEELPGGPQQTAAPSASAAKSATVDEIIQLFKNGKLTPQEAYTHFLALGDESKMTARQAKAYFFGREDSAGARERMLHRMGLNR